MTETQRGNHWEGLWRAQDEAAMRAPRGKPGGLVGTVPGLPDHTRARPAAVAGPLPASLGESPHSPTIASFTAKLPTARNTQIPQHKETVGHSVSFLYRGKKSFGSLYNLVWSYFNIWPFTYFICWLNWQLPQNPFHLGRRFPYFVLFCFSSQFPKFWGRTNPRFLWVCLCIPHIKVWCREEWSCQALGSWAQGTRRVKWFVTSFCQTCLKYVLETSWLTLSSTALKVWLFLAAECHLDKWWLRFDFWL